MMISILLRAWVDVDQLREQTAYFDTDNDIVKAAIYANSANIIDPVVSVILAIIMYTISGSVLADAFDLFQESLWQKIEKGIDAKQNNFVQAVTTFISYTNKFPVQISLGSFRIAKKKIAVFSIIFVSTKIANGYFVF